MHYHAAEVGMDALEITSPPGWVEHAQACNQKQALMQHNGVQMLQFSGSSSNSMSIMKIRLVPT